MTDPLVADQGERDRLRQDLDRTLFVEAGAGTGKTTAVVARIVAMVAEGRLRMERLVAITFTMAAAGELRVRVREGLEAAARAAADQDGRGRLIAAAGEVDRARIETIHAFCSTLLRMHPFEAGLPPDIETLADLAAEIDVRERFRRWFDALEATSPGGDAVRRGLLLGARPDKLLELFIALNDNWDLLPAATWPTHPVTVTATAHGLAEDLDACIALLPSCHTQDELYWRIDGLRLVAERLATAHSEDEATVALVTLAGAPSTNSGRQGNWDSRDGVNACKTIKALMVDVRERTSSALQDLRSQVLAAIASELRTVVLDYADERRVRGVVTYQDLLVRARDLVRDHNDVRALLRAQWGFIAVDEFQDTDPLQAELAFRLCAAVDDDAVPWTSLPITPGRLCVVGDPKQSIYRFRRADIALYTAVEDALVGADPLARVQLSVNFRSGRRIIDSVNAVFGGADGLMSTAAQHGVQAPYVDLVAHAPDLEGGVHVFGGALEDSAAEMWRQEAAALTTVIQRMLEEGWVAGEGTSAGARPCQPDDICILMPSRTNLRNVERALEESRIRYQLESGSLIVATQQVRDLLNILRSIDDPTDQVALVAALRTPAFGCSDVELVRWKEGGGRWSYESPGAGSEARVVAALDALRDLHRRRQEFSVPHLIEEILASRMLRAAAFDDWRPRETRRRYRFVADRARDLARSGRPTLHDAVEYLERIVSDPVYDAVARDDAGEESCVRIMTIHAAKGLEFPIVVVTGLGRKPRDRPQLIVSDRATGAVELRLSSSFETTDWKVLNDHEKTMQDAERVRLLYVALTRARDHLVVGLFRAAKGETTDAAALDERLRGRPDVDVVSLDWKPRDVQRPAADPDVPTADEHRISEEEWIRHRNEALAALASMRSQTATGLAHAEEEAALRPERGDDVAASRRGRAATSLGRAAHAVLQVIDLATGFNVEALARAQASVEGIAERAADVASLVRSALHTDTIRRAATLRHWREVPVGATVEGTMLEGFIDLLFEDPDGSIIIVDYKTDSVSGVAIDGRAERYRLQGAVYALLLREATGRRVSRVEFVFAAAGKTRHIADLETAISEVRGALAADVERPSASLT
jgi:ATP-dependent helicase/nuclease subunit A